MMHSVYGCQDLNMSPTDGFRERTGNWLFYCSTILFPKNVSKNTFWNKGLANIIKAADIINYLLLLLDYLEEKSEFGIFKKICENWLGSGLIVEIFNSI